MKTIMSEIKPIEVLKKNNNKTMINYWMLFGKNGYYIKT